MSGHSTQSNPPGIATGLEGVQRLGLLVGIAGLAVAAALAIFFGFQGFARAYLYGYLFWLALPIASIGFLCISHLAPGTWSVIIRRLLESSAATISLMAILALPLLMPMSLEAIYPWARAPHDTVASHEVAPAAATEAVDHEHAEPAAAKAGDAHAVRHEPVFQSRLGHKAKWFSRGFFYARALGYFVIWGLLAFVLNRWSYEQNSRREPFTSRLNTLGAPGLIILFLAATFALIDWAMSLDTNWFSTIYGAMLLIGMAQVTLAVTLIVLSRLVDRGYYADILTPSRLRDLGNMLLALTMLWAYTSFSQFLIMWSGNLAEEVPWYLNRSQGGWQFVVAFLMLCGFFLPFGALLFRDNKHSTSRLRNIAVFIFIIHLVDLYWILGPDIGHHTLSFPIQELAAFAGIGGLWLAAYVYFLQGKPLLPENDPTLVALREYDREHAHAHQPHGHAHPA